jgi:hypothetical protein
MKYIISEEKLNKMIFLFLESYLTEYPIEDNGHLVVFGKGDKNQIAYDIGDRILFVRDSLHELVKKMFSLTDRGTREIFKQFMESKGYKVKRMV